MKKNNALQGIRCTVGGLLSDTTTVMRGAEEDFRRICDLPIDFEQFCALQERVRVIGVTNAFREVIAFYSADPGEIPAGFRPELILGENGELRVDLKRDIGYGKNGEKRPTNILFSADCANPYEIAAMRNLLANVTTNPAIIYERFINNPKANVGHLFNTREEVLREIAKNVGSGVDISVEINDPFASEEKILEEMAQMAEILSPYQIVVKVPHLGPLNRENQEQLLAGNFPLRYDETGVSDPCRSHDLALMLHEHGYRVNFTLMADGYQTAMALQAKPSFINCFMRNRFYHSEQMRELLACYDATGNEKYLAELRAYLIENYYLAPKDAEMSLFDVKRRAEWELEYRNWDNADGRDGLDQARHCLRMLDISNLPETRLIICSMAGEKMYPYIDRMLVEPEFKELSGRVIISASPDYLCSFTSSPVVLKYNESFAKAVGDGK